MTDMNRISLSAPHVDDRRVAQWQDIKTAPKDGTSVLLCCPHGMYVAWWDWEDIDWWYVTDNKHGPFPLRGEAPTHWQALPPAPTR